MATNPFIPQKWDVVYYNDRVGRVIRRVGANHVKVATHRIRPFQDFATLKVTEVNCEVQETWPIRLLSKTAPAPQA